MGQVIRISTNLYQRLGRHAEGFETPASVIEKILNFYEEQRGINSVGNLKDSENTPSSLEIIYYPYGEDKFKEAFLKIKKAYILIHKMDGSTELKEWNAYHFDVNSSVNGNLRSGRLRGWKEKGIFKAEISINRNDLIGKKD